MYLSDISNSIESIYEYLGEERDFNKYESNKLLRRAVERELEIIGEAVNRLLKLDSSIVISDARRIVSLRNWVIHAYDNVDNVIIWGIINKDLPMLEKQVKKLLKE
ncbi:MAG: HepT-like ribonuclease domain-containing protein [Brumimicrobium sp.]